MTTPSNLSARAETSGLYGATALLAVLPKRGDSSQGHKPITQAARGAAGVRSQPRWEATVARMPARKRRKKAEEHRDPIVRFAEALKRSEAREAKEQQRKADERAAAKREAERLEQLRLAKIDLEQAIAAVKRAREARHGIEAADLQWREVKARVIELETGAPPAWAESDPEPEADSEGDSAAMDDQVAQPE